MLIAPINPALVALAGTSQTMKQAGAGQAQSEIRRPAKPVEKQEKSGPQNPRYHRAGVDRDDQTNERMHADFKV